MTRPLLVAALALLVPAVTLAETAPPTAEPLDADGCVAVALAQSAKLAEAEAKVAQHKATLAELEATYYPKLSGMAYVAPMFTVRGDIDGIERRWQKLKHWGPYARLEALLAQPLYTFGRVEAGEEAARERILVEQARVREAELAVALEVRRFYYLRLYALSMQPSLNTAAKAVKEAREKGQEMYDEGTGEVTQADLAKLDYAATEVAKYQLEADSGAALALAALKHTLGLDDDAPLLLADERLPELDDAEPEPLAEALAAAAEHRPEWAQLAHGKKAAAALARAERLAMAPVVFAAGQFRAAWTAMRDDTDNPYHVDPYNEVFGGLAVGLLFDLDPAAALAKATRADALGQEVEALDRFAQTGIPLRVRAAHSDLVRRRQATELSAAGVKAAQKWMAFSAAAYATGTGEAKDLLEGLVAFLGAKKSYYENLQGYLIARAELDFATGRK